ncbi:ATAD5: ATPase family AAA domain containing 5 [Crotalus adamanteus]|uniref:ATAD5: ATPase family AAA domain containing 5 n=1 Tax=Crotalus adamanteus TaxID=8729 RepID=A0AAW1C0I4_CROAD
MAVFAAATASPTDGAAQSCTKRKEDDLSIKAITSYFSPLGKNVESVLSLPKSNNIMDYFKKTINENIASPLLEQESKANSASLENSSRPPSKLKWRGKRNNLNNKLKTDKTLEPEPLVELNKDNDKETANPLEENYKASFMSHNDVALNSLTNGEETLNVCREGSLSTVSYNNEKRKAKIEGNIVKSNAKKLKRRNPKNEMDLFENSTTDTQTKDSGKETNKQIASITESENRSLLLTPDPETNAQMTPQLNENTVTISFEDFLKSQGEDFEQILRKQTSDDFVASDKTDIYQGTQHLPLKKVTVLAQIHSVPPKSLRSQKIASIFVNSKSKAKVKKTPSSSEMEYTDQVTQKRKSNVVIAEEELELAVLESTASETVKLKCTAEERYQFMKAFRQPGAEIVKNGAKRGPSKQKEVEEKSSSHKLEGEECEDHSNQNTPNNALIAYGSSTAHDITEKCGRTRVKNKSRKRKGIVEAEEKDFNINHNQNNNAHGPINRTTPTEKEREFSQKSKGLRRHCRQKIRQSTPEKAMVSQAVTENPPDAPPLQTSTPKTNRSFKNNLYTAEVITEPFDSNSPIRMKFTRINTSDRFTQQNVKVNSTSRSIFKAKKLVEKAKAVQHNRISRTVEEGSHISLRRSSRQRALAEKKRLEKIENSEALDSGTWSLTTVSGHTENPKKLQSVNDVLGKKTKFVKATKKPNGKEKMSLAIRKKHKKSTDEAIIIVKSSEDESENSQDHTEFKARREFLMSGLPESLKKQITKKAAALEAYSAANSCFQKVIHVQQKDDRCSMWRLAPLSCSFLTKLKDVDSEVTDVAKLTLSLGELSVLTIQSNSNDSAVVVPSGWRPVFSQMQRDLLLQEVQSSNPQLPVKLFFDLLLKKQTPPENNKQVNKCESVNSETIAAEVQKEGKRKRKSDDRKCKRKNQKEKSEPELSKSPSQIPCAKLTGAENSLLIDKVKVKNPEVKTTDDSLSGSKPTSLSGGCVNGKEKPIGKKTEHKKKRRMAAEMIFEVNASCQRSGRQILSQLKEATQSHQVNKQGVHGHKPCFFNHYSSTKSPNPLFSEMFDGCFEQITFRVPSLINVASYLQVLCLAENLRTNIRDFAALLTVNNCDIRQSILYLQFWVQSGAGNTTEINGTQQNIKGTTSSNSKKSILENIPQCSTGCTENLLGLKNIFLPSEDLFSFLKREIRTKEDWNKLIHLLTEFQMRNTDFTYSNFEIISSLPLNIIPEAIEIASPACSFIAEKASNRACIDIEYVEEAPPMKKAKRSKCPKKMAVLDDSDLFECGLNYSGFVTLSPDTSTSCLEEAGPVESTNVGTMALKDGTSVNAKDSVFIFQCLNSLTEFLDNMSFLDCCFTEPTQASKQAGKYEDFIWTKGKIKNGLSDEFSAEYTDWWSSQSSGELKATMEALSFKKCSNSISKIMKNQSCLNCSKTLGKNKFEELTLHVSKERADLYFGRSAANSRFLHYLEGIHLPKEILNSLATDFP